MESNASKEIMLVRRVMQVRIVMLVSILIQVE